MSSIASNALSWNLAEIAIELTAFCNLRCEMCSVWQVKKHGPSQQLATELLRQAAQLGARTFIPCGGESFVRPDFVDLLEQAEKFGFQRSEVVTNGMLVLPHLERLQALPSVHLHVSIDGPEEIHDSLRGSGVYAGAVDLIRQARKRGISVGISGVLMRPTMLSATHVIDLACRWGIEEVSFQPFQGEIHGQDRDSSKFAFEPQQRQEVVEAIANLREYAKKQSVRIYTESILDHIPAYCFEGVRPIPPAGCYMPSRFLLVDVHGEIYPCFFMREQSMGNVNRLNNLREIWHGDVHQTLQQLALDSRCPGCLAACSDIASFEEQLCRQ